LRLRDENGLVTAPELATGDGALGFRKALHEVRPTTRRQRCRVHETADVLNALPKSVHGKAEKDLHAIHEAQHRAAAQAALDRFVDKYGAKYDKAATGLAKDRAALLAFYDFPAEHWKHVRSSNPSESTFATVRLRTDETKGCLSRETVLAPGASPDAPCFAAGLLRCCCARVFELARSAERHWRRLNGPNRLGQPIAGVRFRDGEAVTTPEEQAAARAHTPGLRIAPLPAAAGDRLTVDDAAPLRTVVVNPPRRPRPSCRAPSGRRPPPSARPPRGRAPRRWRG